MDDDFMEGYDVDDDDLEGEGEDDPLCLTIRVTREDHLRMYKPWRKALLVKLLGMSIGYGYLSKRLKELWKPKHSLEIITLDNEYFLAKFSDSDDYEHALKGPCMIVDHYLMVRRWCLDFDPYTDILDKQSRYVFPVYLLSTMI